MPGFGVYLPEQHKSSYRTQEPQGKALPGSPGRFSMLDQAYNMACDAAQLLSSTPNGRQNSAAVNLDSDSRGNLQQPTKQRYEECWRQLWEQTEMRAVYTQCCGYLSDFHHGIFLSMWKAGAFEAVEQDLGKIAHTDKLLGLLATFRVARAYGKQKYLDSTAGQAIARLDQQYDSTAMALANMSAAEWAAVSGLTMRSNTDCHATLPATEVIERLQRVPVPDGHPPELKTGLLKLLQIS